MGKRKPIAKKKINNQQKKVGLISRGRLLFFLKKIGWIVISLQSFKERYKKKILSFFASIPFLTKLPQLAEKKSKKKTRKKKGKIISIRGKSGLLFSQPFSVGNIFNQTSLSVAKKKKIFKKKVLQFIKPKRKRGRPKKKPQYTKKIFQSFNSLRKNSIKSGTWLINHYPWKAFFSLVVSVVIIISAYNTYQFIFKDLPLPTELSKRDQIVSTKILDRKGRLLYSIYKDENRTLIPLSAIPQDMIDATIAIEDQDFYNHHGFSIRGIGRALWANYQGKPIQGGSTITQQLVKNTLLSPQRTVRRKLREVLLAVLVEKVYSKEEILEMYFNEIPYGGSTYGVEEAAHRFFDKSAKDLTLAESALLAGLPAAPSAYSPFGSTPELAYLRQSEVLRRMLEEEFITQDEYEAAIKQPLTFSQDTINIQAPHFVFYVRDLLVEQYGEDVLTKEGLEVRTTLDLDIQNMVQQAVTQEVNSLQRLRVSNGAALVTDPKTGEILAMVGSTDYFNFEDDGQVNVTMRPRQPGSSIKPLTYATAFQLGKLTPSSIIKDTPITYQIAGSRPYSPKNYDGKYHGNVTARESLASSYNIPAVKTLASIGVNTLIDKGEETGITTWINRKRFGLSLTLGGGEVLMVDMAKLYGTFANYGQTVDLNPILQITNYKGELLYYNTCAVNNSMCQSHQSFDSRVAYQITDILSDNRARTPAFGPRSVLNIPNQEVAVKTGTTNNLRDNWTIGYTTNHVVAVWVGNNDNQPMSYVASGVTGASPIWNNIMRSLLSEENPHVFPEPSGLIKVEICKTTGTLSCKGCPVVTEELFIPGTEPQSACSPAQFRPKPTPSPEGMVPRDQILDGLFTD